MSADGAQRVITSTDGETWKSAALIELPIQPVKNSLQHILIDLVDSAPTIFAACGIRKG